MNYDLISGTNTTDIRRLTFKSTGELVMLVSRTERDSPAIRHLPPKSDPGCLDTGARILAMIMVITLVFPPILISLMYLILAFKCKGIQQM